MPGDLCGSLTISIETGTMPLLALASKTLLYWLIETRRSMLALYFFRLREHRHLGRDELLDIITSDNAILDLCLSYHNILESLLILECKALSVNST